MALIWMITHKATFLQQQIRNVFYYEEVTGTPSTSEWQDIVDEIRSEWVSNMQSVIVNDYAFTGIDYRRVDDLGYPSFSVTPTLGNAVGSVTVDPVATQVAMLVSVKGNTPAPNRARTYLAGFGQGALVNSVFQSTPISAAETFIDFQSVLNSGGTNVLQRVSARWNTAHTLVTAVNNIAGSASVASAIPATQRRRRIGVGI